MTLLADHSLLLALPAFAPAVVVAGVVAWLAIRDRRNPDPDSPQSQDRESKDTD
ncbi:hypothetical protein [Mycolicibacterium diernhoferi]|uniref:Uncharacterized protein n=1 Tax=Mycolicibacterium diernhoferi TaxID=1801 RepID=A0A2A7NP40_9MYCO|nr:hypothetical protein [Mycolicibacterium diernhoferi]PEG52116.1 hypothetical protein CRI78_22935 [Mycolicibacterium diernhoferi]QYL22707.1 hypothetical protein K0O62_28005 [Mycolicibacterium diernhoferi]